MAICLVTQQSQMAAKNIFFHHFLAFGTVSVGILVWFFIVAVADIVVVVAAAAIVTDFELVIIMQSSLTLQW